MKVWNLHHIILYYRLDSFGHFHSKNYKKYQILEKTQNTYLHTN